MGTFKNKAAMGSSWIPTPERYSNAKCGLINIQNADQECFRWCMRYHQPKKQQHDDRSTVLRQTADKYDYTGIDFPAIYDDIEEF